MEKDRYLSPILLAFLLFGLFGAASFLVIPGTFKSIHTLWSQNNHTYSHGYILLAFVCYALFVDRRWLQQKPSFLAIILALVAGLVWVAANAIQVLLIQQMLLPVLLFAALLALVGLKNSMKAMVPVLALYLALPVADFLITPLQDLTSAVVTFLLRLQGITAYIEGYDIHLPYGVMRISDGCAGVNYLLAGVCIGLFYSYLNLRKVSLKLWAVFLIILLSLIGNWLRVWGLILIGYYSKMESSLVHEHGFFGWVIFAVFAIGYFFYMRKLEAKDTEFRPAEQKGDLAITRKLILVFSVTLVAFASMPLVIKSLSNGGAEEQAAVVNLPKTFAPLSEINDEPSKYGIKIEGADYAHLFAGNVDGQDVMLTVLTFKEQKQGKELIYFANRYGPGIKRGRTIELNGVKINAALLPNETGMVYWGFKVGDAFSTGGLETKLSQLKQVFSSPFASAVILHVPCERYCDEISVEIENHSRFIKALPNVEVN